MYMYVYIKQICLLFVNFGILIFNNYLGYFPQNGSVIIIIVYHINENIVIYQLN